MNKLKKTQFGLFASIGIICLVSVLAIGAVVYAYESYTAAKIVNEAGGIINYNEAQPQPQEQISEELGAMPGTTFTQTFMNWNGELISHQVGTFKDATTTIASFLNPFGSSATSTIELARLSMTGVATSTYTVACGAATTAFATPTYSIISSDSVATSSANIVIENGIATAYVGNSAGPGGGSVNKIMLTSAYPYFVCKVTTSYEGAFTEVTNTFSGRYAIRISQTQ